MAKVFIEESTLTNIGNSIRNKTGKTELIDPALMSAEIDSISSEGGGGGLPEDLKVHSGSLRRKFSSDGWNNYLSTYKDQLEFKDITDLSYAFSDNAYITNIPFEFNIKENYSSGVSFQNAFNSCTSLTTPPSIKLNGTAPTSFGYVFQSCCRIRDFENFFDAEELEAILSNKVVLPLLLCLH